VHVWRTVADLPADVGPTVVVIGNFDGVHRGHRSVIGRARALADERGIALVAVTFDPHPMAVLRPEHAPSMLTSLHERALLLAECGVDHVFALPFSREIAAWTPDEFVDRILVDGLRAAVVVVGANFRYGSRASGDVATLRASGEERGLTSATICMACG
jgi:riboflavin kinase/FMN adenylyltransferase